MLTGFPLVFCLVIGVLFLFFGLIWNSVDMTNLLIKAVNFTGMFASIYVAVRCTHLPIPYLGTLGIWALLGGIMWRTDSPSNILLKTVLLSTTILSACLILVH